jgi:type IV pilus assembly protein PilC
MPKYLYDAKDQTGKPITGTLDAETRDAAAYAVRRMGLYPTNVVEVGRQAAQAKHRAGTLDRIAQRLIHPIWTGVSTKALMLFFRQLATMLEAGMILSSALASAANTGNGKLRRIAREAQQHVSGGGMLSEVLLRYPWIFTRVQTGLLRQESRLDRSR